MSISSGLETVARTLRHRNFAIYAAGSVAGYVGVWIQKVTVGWLAWELTHSGAWVGIVAFADLAPTVVFSPLAGTVADRWNRLAAARFTQILAAALSLVLCGLSIAGLLTIGVLLVLAFLLGVTYAFNQTLQLTIVPSLVPKTGLTSAVALISVVFNLARFIGPAIAGALIVTGGVATSFAVNALFLALFAVAMLLIKPVTHDTIVAERRGMLTEIGDGLRYTANHPGIGPIILLMIATSLGCRPLIELMPGFAGAVFQTDAGGLALMTSMSGVGAVIGGVWLGMRPDAQGLTRLTIGLSLLMAVTTMAFALISNIWLALPVLIAVGFAMSAAATAAQTLIQISVDGAMRGRVVALFGLIFRGGPALGALAVGLASELFGLGAPLFASALIALAAWWWTYLRRGAIAAVFEDGEEGRR